MQSCSRCTLIQSPKLKTLERMWLARMFSKIRKGPCVAEQCKMVQQWGYAAEGTALPERMQAIDALPVFLNNKALKQALCAL